MGFVIFMIAVQMQVVARGVLAYDITGSAQITAIVSVGFAPAMLIFSLFAGAIGERIDKRTIIQMCQVGGMISSLIVGILIITGGLHWGYLFLSSLLQGALFAFQMPARQAALSTLVKPNQISNAVSLNALAMSFTAVVGPGISGLVYGGFGAAVVYFSVAALNLGALILTGTVKRLPPNEDAKRESVRENILGGLKYIKNSSVLKFLILQGAVVALLSVPFRMLIQVFAKEAYNATPSQVGWLLVSAGVGGLIGALFSASLRSGQKRGLILLLSALVSAASLGLIAGVPFYWVGLVGMVGLGVGEAGRWALGQSLIIEAADQEHRSRVMSAFMMTFGLMPLGIYPLALAMEQLGFQTATAGLAVVLGIAGVLFLFQSRLRRIE